MGLFWFIIVYALVRSLLAGPFSVQNGDMLAILIGVIALVWLIIRHIDSEIQALGLSVSLFAMAVFVNFMLNAKFHVISVVIAVVILSYAAIMINILKNKSKEFILIDTLLILAGRLILTLSAMALIELYLVPLILAP